MDDDRCCQGGHRERSDTVAAQHAPEQGHTTSAGHTLATGGWLDAHFEAARPEYEAMLRAAGFQPGWRVLDAGCGGGPFLPLLAEIVGPTGHLTALDLAPENIAAVAARQGTRGLPRPVETRVGSLTELPYPDDTFDGVWCANTAQYLTDDELATALAELRRVVRPGGLVAVKDSDATSTRFTTRNPFLMPHYLEASCRAGVLGGAGGRGPVRTPEFRAGLARSGLSDVWARTWVIERYAPHRPVERQFFASFYRAFGEAAAGFDLPEEDQAEWAWLQEHAEAWVEDPAHAFCEGNVLAVGQVPPSK